MYEQQFHFNLDEHGYYKKLQYECKTALMKSIHESFYHDLKHPVRGFAGVEIHHIYAHLLEHYGTPTREQLEANKEEYQTPHNLNDTVKTTMMKKKECQSFAAVTRAEITDNNLIQGTLSAFPALETNIL